ncbi:uncharacterized protein LOC110382326 isoform X1 [Helicoverpa armigera]|uniref:uncharacterized protein LOC110382326 isoform X1 n=1 Tax=Helicoverpa armigera TaxID=29058 RepID=UPI000B383556
MSCSNSCSARRRSSSRACPISGARNCPIQCITKLILFLAITIFILYVPLGNTPPNAEPQGGSCLKIEIKPPLHDKNTALCCICDMYNILVKVGKVASDTIDRIVCLSLEALYEGKLQFYRFLETVDSKDLCRAVCCREERVGHMASERSDRVPCKCSKSRACRKTRVLT